MELRPQQARDAAQDARTPRFGREATPEPMNHHPKPSWALELALVFGGWAPPKDDLTPGPTRVRRSCTRYSAWRSLSQNSSTSRWLVPKPAGIALRRRSRRNEPSSASRFALLGCRMFPGWARPAPLSDVDVSSADVLGDRRPLRRGEQQGRLVGRLGCQPPGLLLGQSRRHSSTCECVGCGSTGGGATGAFPRKWSRRTLAASFWKRTSFSRRCGATRDALIVASHMGTESMSMQKTSRILPSSATAFMTQVVAHGVRSSLCRCPSSSISSIPHTRRTITHTLSSAFPASSIDPWNGTSSVLRTAVSSGCGFPTVLPFSSRPRV